MEKKRAIIWFEIFLLITSSIAFSYILKENSAGVETIAWNIEKEGKISSIYRVIIETVIGSSNIVSAEPAVYTCLKGKDGSICQEFPTFTSSDVEACNEACDGECLPARASDVSQCKLGTCYDSSEGLCSPNTGKQSCESSGKQWFDDKFGNVNQCKQGCCVLGDETSFTTQQQCAKISSQRGFEINFKPEVNTELACIVLSKTQEEGACVFDQDFEKTCKFTTKSNCLTIGGDFQSGVLCSYPELNTVCEKQKSTSCVEGKDEIYWFDSCGNRENIYTGSNPAQKDKSWNEGKILAKQNSCELGNTNDPLRNQATCGNCNYLTGSTCGQKTSDEKLSDNSQNFVCKDLRCIDSSGKERQNGESWCAYQGAIGTDKGAGNFLRGTDTPGSRHFREVCIDGEVRVEQCADYRNEICVEAQAPTQGGDKLSSAACRINRWQQCLEYNTQPGANTPAGTKARDNQCEKNPDCFVKEVNIDDGFKFNMCAPKYPPGFDLGANSESAEGICSMASQTCTVVYVKKISGWKCVANCDCEKAGFAQQMNDLCMSLGDCGASSNYLGEYSDEGYAVKKAPKLSGAYVDKLKSYEDYKNSPNKFASPGNTSSFYESLGIPEGLGDAGEGPVDPTKSFQTLGMISGAAGVGLIWAAGAGYLPSFLTASVATVSSTPLTTGVAAGQYAVTFNPGLSAFGGALAGAGIGFAATSMLIKFLGIGPGLSTFEAYGLMAAGTIGAGLAGYALASGSSVGGVGGLFSGAAPIWGVVGAYLFVAVIVAIVIMKFLGVGKTKKIKVQFSCYPWQAPNGGDNCGSCGSDGLPCSRYSCQSLGQTCEFINEGTGNELCIDIAPNDVTPPVINPLQSALSGNFSYVDVNQNGFKIKGTGSEGECVKANIPFVFGLEMNEPSQCRFDVVRSNSYDEMEFEFGGRTVYLYNHTQIFSIPSLESLGIPGYDPNARSEYNLYVRCKDKSGNINQNEYAINFCIQPGDDLTPPYVNARDPQQEYISFGTNTLNATIYTNEPAECKFSKEDKNYDLMENVMNCENDVEDQTLKGFACQAEFEVGNKTEDESYYVRCKDQPWLDESRGVIIVDEGTDENGVQSTREIPAPGKKRNVMSQSYQFNIKKSKSELIIDSIKPSNQTLVFGTQPVTIESEIKTSGGVDGSARCAYKSGDNYIDFFDTLGKTHKQTFQGFFEGDKILDVRCVDSAGNVAEKIAAFKVKIDTQAPIVTRVYDSSGSLIIVTDEDAECVYKTSVSRRNSNSCSFTFEDENVTRMDGFGKLHGTSFDGTTHYVKCKDVFGNAPGSCSIIVKGG